MYCSMTTVCALVQHLTQELRCLAGADDKNVSGEHPIHVRSSLESASNLC